MDASALQTATCALPIAACHVKVRIVDATRPFTIQDEG